MINFHIPEFYNFIRLYDMLYCIIDKYSSYFHEDIKIGSIYGTFPGAIWNGGRYSAGSCDIEDIKYIVNHYASLDIPLRFTFTNSLLNESHLNDEFCNNIMEIANTGKNEILVNNNVLEQYLRETYPNYKYILSTTSITRGVDNINLMCDKYDYVVLDYNDNKDKDVLTKLRQKDKIEILLNESCIPNCPKRKEHYKFISKQQLDLLTPEDGVVCPVRHSSNLYDILGRYKSHFITDTELYTNYIDLGFNNFKIKGREESILYTIESLVMYMVKPEYKDFIRYELLKSLKFTY